MMERAIRAAYIENGIFLLSFREFLVRFQSNWGTGLTFALIQQKTMAFILKDNAEKNFKFLCQEIGPDLFQSAQLINLAIAHDIIKTKSQFEDLCLIHENLALTFLTHPHYRAYHTDLSLYFRLLPFVYFVKKYRLDKPITQQLLLKQRSLQALNLAAKDALNQHTLDFQTRLDSLSLIHNQEIVTDLFTTESFMRETQFNSSFGYYTSGKIRMNFDYRTHASGPDQTLAIKMAVQLFWARQRLLVNKKIDPSHPFHILEIGIGNGAFCHNILNIIKNMSSDHESWLDLYNTVTYHIIDISPNLIERQRDKENQPDFFSKIHFHTGDMNNFDAIKSLPKMAVIFSNEFFDMVPGLAFSIKDNTAMPDYFVFSVKKEVLEGALRSFKMKYLPKLVKEFRANSRYLLEGSAQNYFYLVQFLESRSNEEIKRLESLTQDHVNSAVNVWLKNYTHQSLIFRSLLLELDPTIQLHSGDILRIR